MKAYQCKVIVKSSKPPVWWRCRIPAGISFSALSLILDTLTGESHAEGFYFEIFRTARVWEFSNHALLQADFCHDGYSAAHTAIDRLFILGKAVQYRGSEHDFRIEIEASTEEDFFSYPILLKWKADIDRCALQEQLKNRFSLSEREAPPLTRSELLRAERDGMLSFGCIKSEPVRGETWFPSGNTMLESMGELLRKTLDKAESSPGEMLPLGVLLGSCPKRDLLALARYYKIPGAGSMTVADLTDALDSLLLEPDTIRKAFLLLPDADVRAFEAALAADGPYPIPETQADCFDTLSYCGYAFVDKDEDCVLIPMELHVLYPVICTPSFHEQRRKVQWVMRCLNEIVPPYYAILPLKKFCRLCRRTEAPVIRAEEVPELLKLIPDDVADCIQVGDEVVSRQLAEEPETYAYIKRVQGDKPFFIMREQEIEELLQRGYPYRDANYAKFVRFLRDDLKMQPEEAETFTALLHKHMAYGADADVTFELLENSDVRVSKKQLQTILQMFRDMSNNTPTFYNRGFTPNRMHEHYRR